MPSSRLKPFLNFFGNFLGEFFGRFERTPLAVPIFTFLFFISSIPSAAPSASNAFPSEGVYVGEMTLQDGSSRPLVIALSYTANEDEAPSDEIFPIKRRLQANFIINDEGGPYAFSYVNYNFDSSKFDMQYRRNAQSDPTLHFSGSWSEQQIISGKVTGLNDVLGKFSVKFDSHAVMKTTPILNGNYKGEVHYLGGEVTPLSLRIDSSPNTSRNPEDMELEYSAGHVGGFVLGSWEASIGSINIDYFRNRMRMTYTEQSGTLIYDGTFDGNTMSGSMNSSIKGRVGTFTVKREIK